MSDWRRGTISDLAKGYRGVTYSAGQLKEFKSFDTVTLLRSNNISHGQLNFTEVQIVSDSLVSTEQYLSDGDIAVCMSNGSKHLVGKAGQFISIDNERFTVGAFCSVFRPTEIGNSSFVSYVFQSKEYRKNLDLALAGTAINNLRNVDVEGFSCDIPPLAEQGQIAKILDTLDTAIHETEALIAKLKAVKQGLLHDLLTRGIAANGELRPPQTEAPHLYKLSPLGWIPKEWGHPLLGELLTRIDAGWSPSCPEEPPAAGEWGVLKVSAISSGIFDPQESKRLPSNLKPIPSIEVHTGDVLLARANGVAEFVATTVLVHETPSQLMLSDKTLRLVPDENHVIAGHLARAMAHGSTRKQINGMLNGSSGQRNISQGQIRRLCIPLPSLLEQRISENRATEIEKRVKAESMTLTKLISLKSSLMDDLLTGRVRVTPLLEAAAP